MARIPYNFDGTRYGSGSISIAQPGRNHGNPNASGGFTGVSESADAAATRDIIIERIKQSSIYQSVYNVFSAESDRYWLDQLVAIVDSVIGANNTVWDDLGLSSASGDKIEAIYQDAINNIRTLYEQYKSYKNSLPSTQVQQYSLAGINSGVTGQGVTGSEVGSVDIASGASSLPSTNSGDYFFQAGKFALDTVTGLSGVLSSFLDLSLKYKDLRLRNAQFDFDQTKSFADFKKSMADSGVILKSTSWSELDDKDPSWHNSASARSKALHNAYEEIMSTYSKGPLVSHAASLLGYADPSLFGGFVDDSLFLYPFGVSLNKDLQQIGELEFELAVAKARHSVKVRKSQVDLAVTPEDVVNAENARKIADDDYAFSKATAFVKRFDKLAQDADNGSLVAKIELINLMQNADWQESLLYILGEKGEKIFDKAGGSKFKDYLNELSK